MSNGSNGSSDCPLRCMWRWLVMVGWVQFWQYGGKEFIFLGVVNYTKLLPCILTLFQDSCLFSWSGLYENAVWWESDVYLIDLPEIGRFPYQVTSHLLHHLVYSFYGLSSGLKNFPQWLQKVSSRKMYGMGWESTLAINMNRLHGSWVTSWVKRFIRKARPDTVKRLFHLLLMGLSTVEMWTAMNKHEWKFSCSNIFPTIQYSNGTNII